ncbi:rhomboid family intramembrane serine protease [Candidatus Micrarchaeota archaeon]|nr:rhomboid family intramembrane serine protease [Candidatus Micrarchaeota archaeon]
MKIGQVFTVTNILTLAITFSFVIQLILPEYTEAFYFSPDRIVFEPHRILTYNFLHLNLLHLFLNTYALYIFGNLIETNFGKKQLLIIFFVGGMVAMIAYFVSVGLGLENETSIIFGSSGAVSALLGAAAARVPNLNIKIFLIKMKVQTAAILFLIYELIAVLGIFSLQANALHSAHFGGLIFGYIYLRLLKKIRTN